MSFGPIVTGWNYKRADLSVEQVCSEGRLLSSRQWIFALNLSAIVKNRCAFNIFTFVWKRHVDRE